MTPLHDGAPPVGLIDGAIASSSVPMVFPARRLGEETYVDGGCLQNIPLAAAVALDATRIFTVVAIPLRDADHDRPSRPMWAARELGFLETQEANLAIPLPEGTTNTVITPTLDVVGSFEVHRGLMRIDIDYGWMRAQETLADTDDGLRPIVTAATDTITVQRTRAWHLERRSMEQGGLTPTRLVALRRIKAAVRSAVLARTALGFAPPPGAERWWTGYETHSLPVPDTFPDDPGPREPGPAEAADDRCGSVAGAGDRDGPAGSRRRSVWQHADVGSLGPADRGVPWGHVVATRGCSGCPPHCSG